jgi:glutathione synthase/RimK-type ligase-like ATP-grasp enzyme
MSSNVKVAVAQINCSVGDFECNCRKIVEAAARAVADGARVLVTPELSLTGYPPEDLILKPALVERAQAELERAIRHNAEAARWQALVDAADRCADKLATIRVLAAGGVPTLPTLGVLAGFGTTLDDYSCTDQILVTKPSRASKGRGVRAATRSETLNELRSRLPLVDGLVDHQIVQPRADQWGIDHRVVVADGEVVAMTRRHGVPGAITTNTRGSTVVGFHVLPARSEYFA